MKNFCLFLWNRWWLKWPLLMIAVVTALLAIYVLTYSSRAERAIAEFEAKWEPVVGSFKVEDVFPPVDPDLDFALSEEFEELNEDENFRWEVCSHAFPDKQSIGSFTHGENPYDGSDAKHVVDLVQWYEDEILNDEHVAASNRVQETRSEKEIALEILGKLESMQENTTKLRIALKKYPKLGPILTNGEVDSLAFHDPVTSFIAYSRIFGELSLLKLKAGDIDGAIEEYKTAVIVRDLARSRRTLLGVLVEIAIDVSLAEIAFELVRSEQLSREQLKELHSLCKPRNYIKRFASTGLPEYVYGMKMAEYITNNDVKVPILDQTARTSWIPESYIKWQVCIGSSFMFDHVYYRGGKLTESFTMSEYKSVEHAYESQFKSWKKWQDQMAKMNIFLFRQMVKVMEHQARMDVTYLGVACALYKHDHGKFPSSLDQLKGRYIESLPTDPFNVGKNYRYKLDDQQRPVIFSLGQDEDNDNGRDTYGNREDTDIAWKYYRMKPLAKPLY